VISERPCNLLGLVVTPSGDKAEVTVYDGQGTGDPVILTAVVAAKDTKPIDLSGGIRTNRGLFIGSFTDITGILVIWEPLQPGG